MSTPAHDRPALDRWLARFFDDDEKTPFGIAVHLPWIDRLFGTYYCPGDR